MATLYFIVGPTAVGKTALSVSWAELNNAEILSCDSLLLYRGMDIGTAKPSLLERSQIVHHGIDQVSINTRYSVHDYLQLSQKVVSDIRKKNADETQEISTDVQRNKKIRTSILDGDFSLSEKIKLASEKLKKDK